MNGCWCCGQTCMFCGSIGVQDCNPCWCPECKISGCDWCCGCPECQKHHRGGWSWRGIQVRHGGNGFRKASRDPALQETT